MRLQGLAIQSIARRLFITAAALSLVVLLIASVALTQYFRRSAEEVFENRLQGYFETLTQVAYPAVEEGRKDSIRLNESRFDKLYSGWYWQLTRLDDEEHEIWASLSLYASQLPKLSDSRVMVGPDGVRRGVARGPDGRDLRIFEREVVIPERGVFLLQVAGSTEETEREIANFRFALLIAFALLALALALATAIQVRIGLGPLRGLERELGEVRRGARERIGGVYPTEVTPLVDELNLLIAANRDIVERARTQVGNLAHALKTPLSVLINEADAAPSPLAEKVGEQARIMRDQIGFYLDRARAAARAGAIGATTEVEPVIAALLRTFSKIYAERGVSFAGEAPQNLRFLGERQDLEEMIGNLLDNAGKWASERVAIEVAVDEEAGPAGRKTLLFRIDDDGPGLPPQLRSEATQRGRRLDETKPGSGLGLSIVTDLAAAHGGSLQLEASQNGGLRALLRLPGV